MARRNTTSTGTWCCIGLVGVVAVLGLIFGGIAYDAIRQMQSQQAPGEFEAQEGSRFIMPQKNLIIGMDKEHRGRSPNTHNLETGEAGEVGALFFGDQAEISVESDGVSSKMSVDLNFNATDFLKQNGPPCGGSPTLTIDPRNDECPRGFVGINTKDPQCHLHVNETMCVEGETLFSGNVTIDGILFVENIVGLNITAVQCNNDTHCDDVNNCTVDQCVSDFCEHSLIGECASSNDCPGNGVCGSDCTCMQFIKRQCEIDSECDDTNNCTEDSCVLGICTHDVPGCDSDHFCNSNEICNPSTCSCELACNETECNTFPCEVWTCSEGDCIFLHEDVGCCTSASDCDDNNHCSNDLCINNVCSNSRLLGGCVLASDCGPGQICTSDCECAAFPGLCDIDDDCDDFDNCTEDICQLTKLGGVCKNIVKDEDGDGIPCNIDCNDTDNSIGGPMKWFRDADEDGDGDIDVVLISCDQPDGYVKTNTDCDDNDPNVFSGSFVCNFTDFYNQFEFSSNPIDNEFELAGSSVSVHNDKMIVGAPGSLQSNGAAIILSRNFDNIWIEEAFLEFGINQTNQFGTEVKIDNNLAIVMCPNCQFQQFVQIVVSVYEFNGTWVKVQSIPYLLSNDIAYHIDLLDEKILISASNTTSQTASISVYDRNQTTGDWELIQDINADGFVTDIAFDKANSNYFTFGIRELVLRKISVYFFSGGLYNLITTVIGDPDEFGFGFSVDFHNGIIIVGSPHPINTSFKEKGFVYEVSGTNVSFVQFVRPKHVSVDEFSQCGVSVAIYDDIIIIGCPTEKVNNDNTGAVNVFQLIAGQYKWISRMTAPSMEILGTYNFYGQSVDITDRTIIVGAPFADITQRIDDGNVYINRCNEIRTC